MSVIGNGFKQTTYVQGSQLDPNINLPSGTTINGSQYTAADVLTKVKTVDGTGSGLDADLVDGVNPSDYYSGHINPTSIYNGNVAVDNTVVTAGFATALYTGNGATQSITTGVDMATQWGNDASETFDGLVWGKSRSLANSNELYDTVRGANNRILSNTATAADTTSGVTSFNNNGFSLGNAANLNTNLATQVAWNFQTTHRISGTTNQGQPYTCHYNPTTGFTMVQYTGSGTAGHQIPTHLPKRCDFSVMKSLTTAQNWIVDLGITNSFGILNATNTFTQLTESGRVNRDGYFAIDGAYVDRNASGVNYVYYGWMNSTLDASNVLQGNYEVGTYVGTGAAGNTITTKGKPAWLMTKALSGTSDWIIHDNKRGDFDLFADLSIADTANPYIVFNSDGFLLNNSNGQFNAAGASYLYMVVYDNDSGSGLSKYPKATDNTHLNISAHVPYAQGVDTNGAKTPISYKNETITLTGALVEGKNYVASLADGTYVPTAIAPSYGTTNPATGDFYNLRTRKWYSAAGAEITSRNYLDCVVYADQNGQPVRVEQTAKTTYFESVVAGNLFGQSAITQDVTSIRFVGIRYKNANTYPILLIIRATTNNTGSLFLYINEKIVGEAYVSTNGATSTITAVIKPGETYYAKGIGSFGVLTWTEG